MSVSSCINLIMGAVSSFTDVDMSVLLFVIFEVPLVSVDPLFDDELSTFSKFHPFFNRNSQMIFSIPFKRFYQVNYMCTASLNPGDYTFQAV